MAPHRQSLSYHMSRLGIRSQWRHLTKTAAGNHFALKHVWFAVPSDCNRPFIARVIVIVVPLHRAQRTTNLLNVSHRCHHQ